MCRVERVELGVERAQRGPAARQEERKPSRVCEGVSEGGGGRRNAYSMGVVHRAATPVPAVVKRHQ